jgi:hypothetical protein
MHRIPAAAVVYALATTAAGTLAQTSSAVGPSLPALDGNTGISAPNSEVSYLTRLAGSSTTLRARTHGHTMATLTLPGGWGIQLATLDGALTGLSPNGRVLVLSDNVQPNGSLRTRSRFAVINTHTLTQAKTISLRGDFTVDALSPNGELLYLIHHLPQANASKYQVQAYNLAAGQLLPGVIADKSQAGWTMAGYPVTRTTTSNGGWVYTLYRQDNNYPFIHALDTIHHTAICVGLPANWTTDTAWISTAHLKLTTHTLAIKTKNGKTRFLLNTHTFRITTPTTP